MKEENNNRKVLVSVKVSTLVLIVVIIAVAIVGGIKLSHYVASKETNAIHQSSDVIFENEKGEQVSLADAEIVDTTSENVDEAEMSAASKTVRKELITSRSSEGRDQISVMDETEEVIEGQTEQVISVTTPIDEVKISVDMDLTVRTGLSRADFITLISGVSADTAGFFEENAGTIYDVCEKYSINEIFFCGLISAESGWNIAGNHRNTYNYISLMSGSGLIRFSSVEDGLEQAAKILHTKYLTPGGAFYYGPTLAAMKTRFCPASPTWVNLVYGRMAQIV